MTATLNHDELVPNVPDSYNIIYGNSGWTDEVDDGTVDLLVDAGVIRLIDTFHGVYNRTRIYVSNEGKEPKR